MGLHREGSQRGLAPFQTELQRRVWWYILALNYRACELQGMIEPLIPPYSDTLLPLNVNDQVHRNLPYASLQSGTKFLSQDLQPGLHQLPASRTGPTEMIFCFVRYVLIKMSHQQQQAIQERLRDSIDTSEEFLASDLEHISQFKNHLEERYLRLCEPMSPLHVLVSTSARITIGKMQLHAITTWTRRQSESDSFVRALSKDRTLFAYSLRIIGYCNTLHSHTNMKRFGWHIQHHFPWGALIHLLRGLTVEDPIAICESHETLLNAWQQMNQLHTYNPEILQVPLTAVQTVQAHACEMTLQAWDNCTRFLPPQAIAESLLMVMVANRSLSHDISLSDTNTDEENKHHLTINHGLLYW